MGRGAGGDWRRWFCAGPQGRPVICSPAGVQRQSCILFLQYLALQRASFRAELLALVLWAFTLFWDGLRCDGRCSAPASGHKMPATPCSAQVQNQTSPGRPPELATLGMESTSIPSLRSDLPFSLFMPPCAGLATRLPLSTVPESTQTLNSNSGF